MVRKIIVVIVVYGNDYVKFLGGQVVVLLFIVNVGVDGVEICCELCSVEEFNVLFLLVVIIECYGLLVCYFVLQVLFIDNGEFNLDFLMLFVEV